MKANPRPPAGAAGWEELYPGGYLEGDPLDPHSPSASLSLFGAMSALHAVYLRCIKPYVGPKTVALEIGPGTGAWTKAMLPAKEVWCLDALPASHHGFFEYLGHPRHVNYFQVSDFSCRMLPANHFDYMFSFGTLCHLNPEQVEAYAKSLFPKLKSGSHCFWMVADYDKLNAAFGRLDHGRALSLLLPPKPLYSPLKWLMTLALRFEHRRKRLDTAEDMAPRPGRWYHLGVEKAVQILGRQGYQVLDPDTGASPRDPILHFVKP